MKRDFSLKAFLFALAVGLNTLVLTMANSAYAVSINRPPGYTPNGNLGAIIDRGVSWFIVIMVVIFVVMFMRGGWDYISAGDDTDKIEGARRSLTNAIMGLIVAIVTFAVVQVVNIFLGTNIVVGLPFD